jgi:nucleosome binding factor SPN SPT16 subunit
MAATVTLDKAAFFRRAARLYETWKNEDEELSKADAIVLSCGVDDEVVYSKSSTFQIWLLGYELADTITVFTEKGIFFLSSKKKIDFLKPLESGKENQQAVPPVTLLVRNKVRSDVVTVTLNDMFFPSLAE